MLSFFFLLFGLIYWLFNITFIGISVNSIYLTAHRCAGGLKKVKLRLGSQSHTGRRPNLANARVSTVDRDISGLLRV